MPSTITLTARELSDLVTPVIPHADKSGFTPVLAQVLIRAKGSWVTAMTTDRYRIALQRVKPETAPDADFAALIPLRVLARIQSTFKGDRLHSPTITLTLDGLTLKVGAADVLDGLIDASFGFALTDAASDFPKVDRLVHGALTAESPAEPHRMDVNPHYLADFRLGRQRHETLHATPVKSTTKEGAVGSWLIRIGDDFIGLLVPVTGGTEPADGWLDLIDAPPVVTPAEPVAVPA